MARFSALSTSTSTILCSHSVAKTSEETYFRFQIILSHVINSYRLRAVKITDRRVRLMNEVLTYVKLIKMYAWELPFAKAVAGEVYVTFFPIGRGSL